MADVEHDEDSDLEEETQKVEKISYAKASRDLSSGKKRKFNEEKENENNEESSDEGDLGDEEYFSQYKKSTDIIEYDEDDFHRQLRLEREEQLSKEKKEIEAKTKIDADGTEYEWDPTVKGWFPKVRIPFSYIICLYFFKNQNLFTKKTKKKINDTKFIEYQQNYIVSNPMANATAVKVAPEYAKLLENKFYLFNGSFYKWDFKENRWQSVNEPVYSYIDYMTGVSYDWNQGANEWQKSKEQIAGTQASTETSSNKNSNEQKQESKEKMNKKKEGWVDVNQDKNTNVYVSGLPLDITDEEFEDMMSKYGIIMKDPLTNKLKLKLYRDEHYEVKGDGRCCYLMVKI
jgi:hypothetical protein